MGSHVPQQIVDPRSRGAMHIEIGSPEEVGFDDHVLQVKLPFQNPATNFPMG